LPSRPSVILFDVNETLSDMAPMASRFAEVGAPDLLARVWFASVLRDGFAVTATGGKETFSRIARGVLETTLAGVSLNRPAAQAADHILSGFTDLSVHPDVPEGVRLLREGGLRLATLSNGSADVADRLLRGAGLRGEFERLLSVEEAGAWKPAPAAYGHAARVCSVPADQMLLVAVHPWDIHGAHQAGLRTGWITRRSEPYPGYFAGPDLQASDLSSLARQIVLSGAGLGDGGLADDQLRLEDDLAVAVGLTVGSLLDQHLHRRLAQLGAGLAHRGQRHRGGRGEVDVVVADDGQVAGHRQAAAHRVLQQPQGQQVVRAERRGWPLPD
jgi:2-haloacid dehalogenase